MLCGLSSLLAPWGRPGLLYSRTCWGFPLQLPPSRPGPRAGLLGDSLAGPCAEVSKAHTAGLWPLQPRTPPGQSHSCFCLPCEVALLSFSPFLFYAF